MARRRFAENVCSHQAGGHRRPAVGPGNGGQRARGSALTLQHNPRMRFSAVHVSGGAMGGGGSLGGGAAHLRNSAVVGG